MPHIDVLLVFFVVWVGLEGEKNNGVGENLLCFFLFHQLGTGNAEEEDRYERVI
jgi:hypothetical protein